MLIYNFNQKWVTNQTKTGTCLHTYQQCSKTGDRRVIIADNVDMLVDYCWLENGSGKYSICSGAKTLGNPLPKSSVAKNHSSVVKPKL